MRWLAERRLAEDDISPDLVFTARRAYVDDDGLTAEQRIIKNGDAVMAKERTSKSADRAEQDIEVDLGGGYSTVYRAGDVIPVEHRGKPSKAASLPSTFTLQDDDDEAGRPSPRRAGRSTRRRVRPGGGADQKQRRRRPAFRFPKLRSH